MELSFQITFKIGGTTGFKVVEVTSDIHKVVVGCEISPITEPTN